LKQHIPDRFPVEKQGSELDGKKAAVIVYRDAVWIARGVQPHLNTIVFYSHPAGS
jgi:hypothetical protein